MKTTGKTQRKNIANESIHYCWEYHGPVLTNAWSPICWNGQYSSVFVFVFCLFVHCQTKWICLIVVEWGLWNNSWVKNLPVRPLAPRRKTPGQLYPAFNDLPGWVRNILKPSTCGRVLASVTVGKNDRIIWNNTKPDICNETAWILLSPDSASSLLAVDFLHRAIDESLTSLPNLSSFPVWEK